MIDDIAQLVAERLFVARAGVRPKIADYDGRGSLASWLRVVSVRVALNALRGGNGRQLPLDDAVLSRLTASKDPALELIKCAYRDDFAAAFRSALAELPARSQNLLRHHLIDLLAPEQIGRLYRVHRTTAMRWLDTARELLIKKTREHLSARLALNAAELDSLLHVMSSQLELTPMLRGIDPDDLSGISVSDAGDVNGDGIDDVIIGADLGDPGGRVDAGETYVVFGTSAGFPASLALASLFPANGGNGSAGFVLQGVEAGDASGLSATGAGDVNGDGIDDLIVGAGGASYVVFGNDAGFVSTADVARLRASTKARTQPWTIGELRSVLPRQIDRKGWKLTASEGRCVRVIGLPSARADAVRSTCRSWRMLPGQACAMSRRSASAVRPAWSPPSVRSRVRISSSLSVRSRSGGSCTSTPASR